MDRSVQSLYKHFIQKGKKRNHSHRQQHLYNLTKLFLFTWSNIISRGFIDRFMAYCLATESDQRQLRIHTVTVVKFLFHLLCSIKLSPSRQDMGNLKLIAAHFSFNILLWFNRTHAIPIFEEFAGSLPLIDKWSIKSGTGRGWAPLQLRGWTHV